MTNRFVSNKNKITPSSRDYGKKFRIYHPRPNLEIISPSEEEQAEVAHNTQQMVERMEANSIFSQSLVQEPQRQLPQLSLYDTNQSNQACRNWSEEQV